MRFLAALLTDAVWIAYTYVGMTLLMVYRGAPVEMLITLVAVLLPFVVVHQLCIGAFEGYNFERLRSESDVAFSALLGVITGTALSFFLSMMVILYYTPATQVIGRSVFLTAGVLNLFILPGWRIWYTRQRRRRGELNSRVLVVGARDTVEAVAQDLERYSRSGHEIVGCILNEEGYDDPVSYGFLGGIDDLSRLALERETDEVLVIGEGIAQAPDKILHLVEVCESLDIPVHILPGFYEAVIGRLNLFEIGGLPLVGLPKHPLYGMYAFTKRSMDIVGACVGLLLSAPIMLATACAIKWDSKGPVFYRQKRVGRNGREFWLIKFRTMSADAEKETGPVWAVKQDPRVTRAGRFLRNKRIDEIPQFWNVLKGEMSLVGPRPERRLFMEAFAKETPLFPLRLRVRPGITSLSHTMGRYDSMPEHRLLYDLVYLSNLSLMLDVRILVTTVKIVLTGRGAQ